MIKQQATREEIKALASDGWRFRKKKRKGKLYISARRKKEEKGLGSYNAEFWAMIEDVNRSLSNKSVSPRKDVLTESKYNPSALPGVTKEVSELRCAMDDVIKYEGAVGFDVQARILASMGLSWFVKGLYDQENKGESLIQFMERNILEQYKRKGWFLLRKDVSKVFKLNQDLRGKIKGDILSIRTPGLSKTFYPTSRDHFFNVHYESHDNGTFESIQKLPTPWIPYGLSLPEDDEEP